MCGENRQEKVFWDILAGVSSRQPDLGSGARDRLLGRCPVWYLWRVHCFRSTGVGVCDDLEDRSSLQSETEWVALLHGTFVHTTSPRVGIGPF